MKLRITFLLLAGLVTSSAVNAASVTTTLNVSTAVGGSCSVSAAGIAFPYNANTITNANGSVTVNCIIGTAYSIALDAGLHYNGGARMVADANSNAIQYSLYQDNNLNLLWGDNGVTYQAPVVNDSGSGSDQVHTVYGALNANAFIGSIVPGQYNDTVNVTINY